MCAKAGAEPLPQAAAFVQGKGQARQGHGVCRQRSAQPPAAPQAGSVCRSCRAARSSGRSLCFGTSPKCSSKLINASFAR